MAGYELRVMPVEAVRPADYNPRVALRLGDPEYEKLRASVNDLGVIDPLVWNETTGRLVGGHQRLRVCIDLGIHEVPCFVVHLTDEKEKQANIALNKIAGRFDEDKLRLVLEGLSPEVVKLSGFDPKDLLPMEDVSDADWFGRKDFDGNELQEGNDEYNGFVEKFKPKKTTDDCYTPALVYDAIADWVAQKYGLDRASFVRPFYPGGDYQAEDYPDGCVVVDNPPFSILAQIIDFYCSERIPFFLFAPALASFGYLRNRAGRICLVLAGARITYENGANVMTSFITNLTTDLAVYTAPELQVAVEKACDEVRAQQRVTLPKYAYPDCIMRGSDYRLSKYGQRLEIPWEDCAFVSSLDAQKESGDTIYGGGLILSERAAAERAAAERAAAKRWPLSDRELALQASLGGGHGGKD